MLGGLDEVNRSPVLNSLVVAGVAMEEDSLNILRKKVVIRDSKMMTKVQRIRAFPLIYRYAKRVEVKFITPEEISVINKDLNLNDLEANAYGSIVKKFEHDFLKLHVYIDNFDRSKEKLMKRFEKLGYRFSCKITAVHDADKKYPIVSCASIIAKVISEMEYEWAGWKYGKIGSGEPRDSETIAFIKKHINHNPKCNKGCQIIRWSWITVRRLINDSHLG